MDIPDWIDSDAWCGFVAMRKSIKKPLTERAQKLIIGELLKLKTKGHDPNQSLDQSTLNSWLDVYPVKQKQIENLIRVEPIPVAEKWSEPSPEVLAKLRGVIKRVA
jgi:hypothetical protein